MSAYFDFFSDSSTGYLIARRIAQQYDNYPITLWRLKFLAIQDQINEIDGEFDDLEESKLDPDAFAESTSTMSSLKEQRQTNKRIAVQSEPNIREASVGPDGTIQLETVNIHTVQIKYYLIDAELLFSRSPFVRSNAEQFSYVSPYLQLQETLLPADASEAQLRTVVTREIPLAQELKNANLVIEVNARDIQKFITYYQHSMKVAVLESFGELKVSDEADKPLPKVYVKVYGLDKYTDKEFFYRDGYTDIRGKFDYAQTSGDKLSRVKRFGILVSSDRHGSKILEVSPPGEGESSAGGFEGLVE